MGVCMLNPMIFSFFQNPKANKNVISVFIKLTWFSQSKQLNALDGNHVYFYDTAITLFGFVIGF